MNDQERLMINELENHCDVCKQEIELLYYENGQLEKRSIYKDNLIHGTQELYYENGNLEEIGTYKNGELDGTYETYYRNGQVRSKGTIKYGT